MKKLLLSLLAALLLSSCGKQAETPRESQHEISGPRIVALAPNIAEILYAIGLSHQVVGVSKYSVYPEEASKKPCIGGTYDPNWEMLVSLQPDLAIGLDSQKEFDSQLSQLSIPFLGVPHERIEEIMQSILMIGEACDALDKAQALYGSLQAQLKTVQPVIGDEKPRVLVCIGHDEQCARMYIAAKGTFYDDLIELAGGVNACEQTAVKYPEISPEGLHLIQPDIVIDLVPESASQGADIAEQWKPFRAVQISSQYAFIPGPRFVLLLNDFVQALHE